MNLEFDVRSERRILDTGIVRFAGGKSYVALKQIAPTLWRSGGDWTRWVDPMVGGGSMSLWAIQMFEPEEVWLNDLDISLWATWVAYRDHPDELCHALRKMIPDKARWQDIKEYLRSLAPGDQPSTKSEIVEMAAERIYCQRVSYSGFGPCARGTCEPPGARWTDVTYKRVRQGHDILTSVPDLKITCLDFREVLAEASEDDFVFLDPPYVHRGLEMYIHAFDEKDHEDLANRLRDASYKWILTYGDHPDVDELYASWADISRRDVAYMSLAHRHEETFERVITAPGQCPDAPSEVVIGDRLFKISWDDLDFDHIRGLASSIEEQGIKVSIFVTPDGEVIDGRDRLLASCLVGLGLDEIPIREVDVSTGAERVALRLLLQASHKGMGWRTKARHLRDLRAETGWSWPEIERQTGIPKTTAWRWVKKLEDEEAEDGKDEDSERPIGVTLKLPPEVAEAFERIAGEQGLTRAVEEAVGLLVDWSELPEEVRSLIADEDRGEILREALLRYLRLAELTEVA